MGKYFGTDGIRGIPWKFPFTPSFLRKIGYCVSYVFKKKENSPVYIAMDTRETGAKIKRYISQGIIAHGFKVVDLGILTTPCLSYLTQKDKVAFGVMISASHNPPEFNGIKVFSSSGEKINDSLELKIENMLDSNIDFPCVKNINGNLEVKNLKEKYIDFILSIFPSDFLKGYRICLDCANGAGYKIAPEIYRRLGAELVLIGDKPNGKNINKNLGALNTKTMRKNVILSKAFCGISLDGDGDRCILADENGKIFDGDDIISILALFFNKRGLLKKSKVVLTEMSNYGLVKHLGKMGIDVIYVNVGDKNVTEALDRFGLVLGGENSGHIIIREFAPTGDGVLSSLWTLYAAKSFGKTISQIKSLWKRYPQISSSFKISEKIPLNEIKDFKSYLKKVEEKIKGRVLVRYSGTEPLLRIMVEGEDYREIKKAAKEIERTYFSHIKSIVGERRNF